MLQCASMMLQLYNLTPMSVFAVSIGPNAGATGLDAMFRGTLIQTRPLGNDDMMVGTFAVIDDVNSRLSSCTPPEVIMCGLNCME